MCLDETTRVFRTGCFAARRGNCIHSVKTVSNFPSNRMQPGHLEGKNTIVATVWFFRLMILHARGTVILQCCKVLHMTPIAGRQRFHLALSNSLCMRDLEPITKVHGLWAYACTSGKCDSPKGQNRVWNDSFVAGHSANLR